MLQHYIIVYLIDETDKFLDAFTNLLTVIYKSLKA